MPTQSLRPSWFILTLIAVVMLAGIVGLWIPDSAGGAVDFTEYGAAARVLAQGGNPYDGRSLLEYQSRFGWADSRAQSMWNPPWVFPLVLPLAWLPWGVGFMLWSAIQCAVILWACVAAWRLYGGAERHFWVPILLALAFAPMLFLMRLGQIPGFMLFGVVGFLVAMRMGRPSWAGAVMAFTAVKPHLLLPFAVLLACDAIITPKTRKAVLVGSGLLVACALFPMIWNAEVWSQYVEATRAPTDEFHYSTADWDPPILASKLGVYFNNSMAVQFAPSVLATLLLVAYWFWQRKVWNWEQELPRIVLVSFLTTGYGAWGFDLIVLLLPIVQVATWVAQSHNPRLQLWATLGYLSFNAAIYMALLPVIWWTPVIVQSYFAACFAKIQVEGATGDHSAYFPK